MQSTANQALVTTMSTLANAVELGVNVILEVAGDDVSNHIDGQAISPELLSDTLTAKIQARLSKYMGVA